MTAPSATRWYLQWTSLAPLIGLIALGLTWGRELPWFAVLVVAVLLAAAVMAAVHHAEIVAHRVGEPYGSLILAVAVTIIEVALIVTLMLSSGDKAATLARDTAFAAFMITCNGIVGLSVLVSARRRGIAHFNPEGTGAALATVTTLSVMTLALPNFTTTSPGPTFSPSQLGFAALSSLLLYAVFVATQTQSHRDFFLPPQVGGVAAEEAHADPPGNAEAGRSLALLAVALVVVVGLAKVESPAIEAGIAALGLPATFVGVVIALLVLAPETLAAVRSADRGRLQTSLNLAYGSGIASIGLTIPAMALLSLFLPIKLVLGLGPLQLTLMALTVVVSVLTVVPGRATRLQASLHLVVTAGFIFLAAVP